MFPTCKNSQKRVKNQKSTNKHSSFDGLIQEDIELSDIYLAVYSKYVESQFESTDYHSMEKLSHIGPKSQFEILEIQVLINFEVIKEFFRKVQMTLKIYFLTTHLKTCKNQIEKISLELSFEQKSSLC